MLNLQSDMPISEWEGMLEAYSTAMDCWMASVERGEMTFEEVNAKCREREAWILDMQSQRVAKLRGHPTDERVPVCPEELIPTLEDLFPHTAPAPTSPIFGALNAMNDQFDGRNITGRFEPVR